MQDVPAPFGSPADLMEKDNRERRELRRMGWRNGWYKVAGGDLVATSADHMWLADNDAAGTRREWAENIHQRSKEDGER